MFIACLAISGIPPFAGFWSKDEILVAAAAARQPLVLGALLAASGLTAFYVWRMFALAFLGRPRGSHHAHESPAVMTIPLALLAVGACLAGLPGSPWMGYAFQHVLHTHAPEAMDWSLAGFSVLAAALGITAALVGYLGPSRPAMPPALRPLYAVVRGKYYVDELYAALAVRPTIRCAAALAGWDQRVIDGAVNGAGRVGTRLSELKAALDRTVVDGCVNGMAAKVRAAGSLLRGLQSGVIHQYLWLAVTLLACCAAWLTS